MQLLLEKLELSIKHLQCLDKAFHDHPIYSKINDTLNSDTFLPIHKKFSQELYAGGKSKGGLARQMILGDVIEYIFTGRAYYLAAKSEDNFKSFLKLILYVTNQLLVYDSISVDHERRKKYIEALEEEVDKDVLYEKQGDEQLAGDLKNSDIKHRMQGWERFDLLVDSLLPKTLGCPKELVVFAELLRLRKGIVIPLLLIQRVLGGGKPIAPPDFLLLNKNKDIFGIELGYKKEQQGRTFSSQTSIPTVAVDLHNNMHNRCPKCGEMILYCDPVIEAYADGVLEEKLDDSGRYNCSECEHFNHGDCAFSNYYGKWRGVTYSGESSAEKSFRHYHSRCVLTDEYLYRNNPRNIKENHWREFFAQIPRIDGVEGL